MSYPTPSPLTQAIKASQKAICPQMKWDMEPLLSQASGQGIVFLLFLDLVSFPSCCLGLFVSSSLAPVLPAWVCAFLSLSQPGFLTLSLQLLTLEMAQFSGSYQACSLLAEDKRQGGGSLSCLPPCPRQLPSLLSI